MWWESYLTLQAVRMLKWEILAYNFLCLHSQIRATHWIYFLCQVSQSQRCFFFVVVCPDNIFTREFHGQFCSAIWSGVSPIYLSLYVGGEKEQMNVSKQQHVIPLFSFLKNPKKKKMQKCCECMIESVTCRTAHFWQFCLPKEYNCIEDRREICCIVYKVMFIQYFNITSDFRGCYLNRILYLHVKCQQQFIDIVLPFIIRVLIVFLIFV